MKIEHASEWAKKASKDDRCIYYVIKVRGGYDFTEKGIFTPTNAEIIRTYNTGVLMK
jgi:hypothetical protein